MLRRAVRVTAIRTNFHATADDTLEAVLNGAIALEATTDLDSELSSGVLTLRRDAQTWVLNKQSPNQQLWLSSPYSGPARFELSDGAWRHTRDGSCLRDLLKHELGLEYD
ncbi:hypothetical protein CTAYLR_007180 [Chrysophaeum taylorii]|uniref:Ferroxidase n=1 Tax=Chrysophaeum taylorii TaxID=2483200 RepID=A0AAD7UJX8_9STRA|nr:hypothetical protein CTAYLR_007180 [Chrysophaeum taylorii]